MRNPKYITTPVKCVIVTLLNVIRILTILPTAYRYVRNWITLYVYAILDNKGVFVAKDGSTTTRINARRLLKCLIVTEYMYQKAGIPNKRRRVLFDGEWIAVSVLNGQHTLKVNPEKILIVSIPDLFHHIYDVNVDRKTVLDVGAYIGDTVLLWLFKGAKRVIAVEPVKEHYEVLVENCKNLPVITLLASVGEPVPWIPQSVGLDTYGLRAPKGDLLLDVPTYSLQQLVKEYRPEVVKLNCEGCEHAVLEEIMLLPSLGVRTIIVQFHDKGHKKREIALKMIEEVLGNAKIVEEVVCKNPRTTCVWEL
jgi:FkbM family methyltransferase